MGTPISDLLAGIYGVFGILAALHERSSTGRGQVVRTSLLAATASAVWNSAEVSAVNTVWHVIVKNTVPMSV